MFLGKQVTSSMPIKGLWTHYGLVTQYIAYGLDSVELK